MEPCRSPTLAARTTCRQFAPTFCRGIGTRVSPVGGSNGPGNRPCVSKRYKQHRLDHWSRHRPLKDQGPNFISGKRGPHYCGTARRVTGGRGRFFRTRTEPWLIYKRQARPRYFPDANRLLGRYRFIARGPIKRPHGAPPFAPACTTVAGQCRVVEEFQFMNGWSSLLLYSWRRGLSCTTSREDAYCPHLRKHRGGSRFVVWAVRVVPRKHSGAPRSLIAPRRSAIFC